MSSPFQNKFIAKSPLRSHEGKLKRLDKKIAKADTYDEGGDKDYDYLADLQRQRKHLVESHNDPSTRRTEEEDIQVREDEEAAQASAIEMKSPLHGYAEGSDIQVGHYQPTAHLWRDAMNSIVSATLKAPTLQPKKDPCEGLTGDVLAKCKNAQYEAKLKEKEKEDEDNGDSDKETSEEALARVKKEHEDVKKVTDLETKTIDGKFVKVDENGNVTHRMSVDGKWVSVTDIPKF